MTTNTERSNRVDPNERLGNVNRTLWYIGTHKLLVIPILIVVVVIITSFVKALSTLAGLSLGLLVWVGTVAYVRSRRQSVQQEFLQLVEQRRQQRAEQLEAEESIYAVAGPSDFPSYTQQGARTWSAHYFILGDAELRIVGGPMVKFKTRSTSRLGTDDRFSWNDITDIAEQDGQTYGVMLNLSGQEFRYPASEVPPELITQVRKRAGGRSV